MAAVTVGADNLRLDDCDTWTNATDLVIALSTIETDYSWQGAGCWGIKMSGTTGGFAWEDSGTTVDMTAARRNTAIIKYMATQIALLSSLGAATTAAGISVWIGNSTGVRREFNVSGNETYQSKAGWEIKAIDPNVAAYIDSSVGAPVFTSVHMIGAIAGFDGSVKAFNWHLDAVDVGAGLNIVGGDGADTDGKFSDFIDYDEGISTNRFGYVVSAEGVPQVNGTLWIGQSTAQIGVATEFTDANGAVIFADGEFAAGFAGLGIDLTTLSTVTFTGMTFLGRGTVIDEDTRPHLTVVGTTGHFQSSGCGFDSFSTIALTAASTLVGCKITGTKSLIQGGGTLRNCEVIGATNSTASTAFLHSTDLGLLSGSAFTYSQGHAIVITAPGEYTMSNVSFTGYGANGTSNAAILNKSSGNVQINVSSGTGVTYKNSGTTSLSTVSNTVIMTLTGVPDNT